MRPPLGTIMTLENAASAQKIFTLSRTAFGFWDQLSHFFSGAIFYGWLGWGGWLLPPSFGRSDGRRHLREFFEVDERYIALAALSGLSRQGKIKAEIVAAAMKDLAINPEKISGIDNLTMWQTEMTPETGE